MPTITTCLASAVPGGDATAARAWAPGPSTPRTVSSGTASAAHSAMPAAASHLDACSPGQR